MSRFRTLLAVLLAVTWCSAAWHADMEAVGLLFDHDHSATADHHEHGTPQSIDDEHESLAARIGAKDVQVRPGEAGLLWLGLIACVGSFALLLAVRPTSSAACPRGWQDPPWRRVWQFVWRCAPESAAPPALG